MDHNLRDKIWERDKGICQKCKVKLYKTVNTKEEILEDLIEMKEVPVLKWSHECWACGAETFVVTYGGYAANGCNACSFGEVEALDKIVMEKYPFVKRVVRRGENEEIMNTCIKCGANQGDFYLMEELLEMMVDNPDIESKMIDMIIPTSNLKLEDIKIEMGPYEEPIKGVAHVHHKDCNPQNDNPENLILLCNKCHMKAHQELRAISKV